MWPDFPVPLSSTVSDILFSTKDHSFIRNPLVDETVTHHPFNQVIQIVVPALNDVPTAKKLLAKHCPTFSQFLGLDQDKRLNHDLIYTRITNVPIHLLLHRSFIEHFVLTGKVFILSECRSIELDDSLCLLPTGVLHMSLTEKSYHRLGVVGCESILNHKKSPCGKRHIIHIDLKQPLITSRFERQKYYVKLFTSFLNSCMRIDLLVRWIPDPSSLPDVSPLSICKFFRHMRSHPSDGHMSEEDAKLMVNSTCYHQSRSFENKRQFMPINLIDFSSIVPTDESFELLADDAQDWIGAQSCSLKTVLKNPAASDVSTFGFEQKDCRPLQSVLCSESYGFFTPDDVLSLLKEFDAAADAIISANIPFIAMTVSGFEDSPVSWTCGEKAGEHGKDVSGENSYTILLTGKSHQISESVRQQLKSGDHVSHEFVRKVLVIRRSDAYDFSIARL